MNILLLADLHNRIDGLERIAKGRDIILLAGDISNFGGVEKVWQILAVLEDCCPVVLGVPGNCDPPGVRELLEEKGYSLDGKVIEQKTLLFAGLGGTEPSAFNREREYLNSPFLTILCNLKSGLKGKSVVFVSHQPAFHTAVDKFGQGQHTGSRAIRLFIEEVQPLFALSGHIHEAAGIDKIGQTVLVNPGPFKNGFYATAEIENTCINIELKYL